MAPYSFSEQLQRIYAIRQRYHYAFEMTSPAVANPANQLLSAFSRARLELGLYKSFLAQQFPDAPLAERNVLLGLIDSLLSDLTLQEKHYWLALALVHMHFGDPV